MQSINEFKGSGTLTRDPAPHKFESGSRVCNAEIAVSRGRTADYPAIKGWGPIADALAKCKKGDFVFVDGVLRTELGKPGPGETRKPKYVFVLVRHLRVLDAKTGATLVDVHEEPRGEHEEHEEIEDEELAPF